MVPPLVAETDADNVESPISASRGSAVSYTGLLLLALAGIIIIVLLAASRDGGKKDDKPTRKEIIELDEQLIKGEITEEEYVQKLKALK